MPQLVAIDYKGCVILKVCFFLSLLDKRHSGYAHLPSQHGYQSTLPSKQKHQRHQPYTFSNTQLRKSTLKSRANRELIAGSVCQDDFEYHRPIPQGNYYCTTYNRRLEQRLASDSHSSSGFHSGNTSTSQSSFCGSQHTPRGNGGAKGGDEYVLSIPMASDAAGECETGRFVRPLVPVMSDRN